jgi:hypothetical protein
VAMELGPQSASEVRVRLDQRRRHCSSVACFGAEVEIWLAVDRPAGGGLRDPVCRSRRKA